MINRFTNSIVKRIHKFIHRTSRDLSDLAAAKRGAAARAALDEAQEIRGDASQALTEAERHLQEVTNDALDRSDEKAFAAKRLALLLFCLDLPVQLLVNRAGFPDVHWVWIAGGSVGIALFLTWVVYYALVSRVHDPARAPRSARIAQWLSSTGLIFILGAFGIFLAARYFIPGAFASDLLSDVVRASVILLAELTPMVAGVELFSAWLMSQESKGRANVAALHAALAELDAFVSRLHDDAGVPRASEHVAEHPEERTRGGSAAAETRQPTSDPAGSHPLRPVPPPPIETPSPN